MMLLIESKATRTVVALMLFAVSTSVSHGNEKAKSTTARIDSYQVASLDWVKREIAKAPAFESKKVRYNFWVLGDGRQSVVAMAWDESGGTGTGYDTLYVDKNLNGDLTEEGEKFYCENHDKKKHGRRKKELYSIGSIKEAGGPAAFQFSFAANYKSDQIHYPTAIKVKSPKGSYEVSCLPGNINIRWSNDIATAPIYRLAGQAVPELNGRLPGASLGSIEVGRTFKGWYAVKLFGEDKKTHLRFCGSSVGRHGNNPRTFLRVIDKGTVKEELAMVGGCVCGGGYGQHLTIPSRIPPGKHEVVSRVQRPASLGGPAEFVYRIEIRNPLYGKGLTDPAYAALKKAHPKARMVSLRRTGPKLADSKAFPDEPLLAAKVGDTWIRQDCLKYEGHGGDRKMIIGDQQGDGRSHRVKSLLRFDLSRLPKDAKVLGARIRLTLLATDKYAELKNDATIEAYAMRRSWVDRRRGRNNTHPATNWIGPEVYYHSKTPDVVWGKPGAADTTKDRYPDPAGATQVGVFPKKLAPKEKGKKAPQEPWRLIDIDISSLAKDWVAGTKPNHGVLLTLRGSRAVYICTSEFPDYPFRPTLVVAYEGSAPVAAPDADPGRNLAAARKVAAEKKRPLLVKFFAPTCSMCRKADNTTFADAGVKKLLSGFQVVKLQIEEHAKFASDLGVNTVPAVVVLASDGKTKKKLVPGQTVLDKKQFLAALGK